MDFGQAKPGSVAEADLTLKDIIDRNGLPSRTDVANLALEDLLIG